VSLEEVAQIYELRLLLEPLALRQSLESSDDEHRTDQLAMLVGELEREDPERGVLHELRAAREQAIPPRFDALRPGGRDHRARWYRERELEELELRFDVEPRDAESVQGHVRRLVGHRDRRVGDRPVQAAHRREQHRADLLGAQRDDDVDIVGIDVSDALAVLAGDVDLDPRHGLDRAWVQLRRARARTLDAKPITEVVSREALRDLAARGVRDAQEQDAWDQRPSCLATITFMISFVPA